MTNPDYFRAFIFHFGMVYYIHTKQIFTVTKDNGFDNTKVKVSGNNLQFVSVGIAVSAVVFCVESSLR